MNTPAPDYLDAQARGKWAGVYGILQARGEIDTGTLDALACYCAAWGQWRAADEKVTELGLVVKSPAGFAQENPYLAVARKAQTELRRWGDVLKITPKSKKGAASNRPTKAKTNLSKLRLTK
jgi:P27 family predicted phage terminase small subunit